MLVVVWDASESYPKVEGSFGWELQFGVVVRACRAGVGSSFRRNGLAGWVLFCDKIDLLIFWRNSILFSTCFGSMKKYQIARCVALSIRELFLWYCNHYQGALFDVIAVRMSFPI
jgi:hypothetical protein